MAFGLDTYPDEAENPAMETDINAILNSVWAGRKMREDLMVEELWSALSSLLSGDPKPCPIFSWQKVASYNQLKDKGSFEREYLGDWDLTG